MRASAKAAHSALPATRVDWVDYAKGWCIILVVMMHSTLGVLYRSRAILLSR